MSVVPAPDAPAGWRILLDGDGRPVARFRSDDRAGIRAAGALRLEPGVDASSAVPVILAGLRGHRVSGRPDIGERLIAAGATRRRHVRILSRPVASVEKPPEPPAGIRLTALDRPVADLVPSSMAAYPPGHWDFTPGGDQPERVAERLRALLAGELIGRPIAPSRLALDAGGRVVGGAIVTDAPGPEPLVGPWIADLWREPGRPGLGAVLLAHVLQAIARDGGRTAGLTVTHGNPALRVYERAGFTLRLELLSVEVPP
jgi:GNAT superfamily N-acetyltransferase